MLAEELLFLGRDDELRDALDEVDLLLARAVAEMNGARRALEREVAEARRQEHSIDRAALLRGGPHGVVPAERRALREARQLGVLRCLAELAALARDVGAIVDAARHE